MSKKPIENGTKFGRLTVVSFSHSNKNQHRVYECLCSCGKTTYVVSSDLRSGATQSCGCYRSERVTELKTKHGDCKTRLYICWTNMKSRCCDTHNPDYKYYGEKGITVCDEWIHNYEAFRNWAYSHGYKDYLTIDRIEFEDGYNPNNCRWILMSDQQKNKSNSIFITIGRVTKPLPDWAKECHIKPSTLRYRYHHNWQGAELIRPVL